MTRRTATTGMLPATIVENVGTLRRYVGLGRFLDHAKLLLEPGHHQKTCVRQGSTKYVAAAKDDHDELSVEDDQEFLPLHAVGGSTTPPYKVPLVINNVVHTMELDTGASVTLMSETECHKLFPEATLRESSVLLRTYSGDRLPVVGEMDVRVQYGQQIQDLVLTVVTGNGPSLLG